MGDGMLANHPRGTICIEDIEIGMIRSLRKVVTDRDIAVFTAVTTDHNPVHLDESYAQDTLFHGRIAHGMLTAGLISAVIGEQLPGHRAVNPGQSLRFLAPVRPDDLVEAVVKVTAIDPALRRVTLETRCAVGNTVVLKGEALVLAPSRKFDQGRCQDRMRISKHWQGLAPRGASVAMGNFDGVHLGHRAVIDLARGDAPLGVVTFEPHPREFFAPKAPPFRLMNAEARANRLAKLGVAELYALPFDATLAGLSPDEFARDVLAQGLGISHVVVGTDFRFGKGRAGTAADLQALGFEHGFRVTVAELVKSGGKDISSTAIRAALTEGRPRDAAAMLGHWHRIEGEVIHGEKRGRELGYPTANMSIEGLHLPRFGVYAVRVDVLTGPFVGQYMGAASLGVRPMFGENQPNLETFIFDFSGDLYGQHLSVALVDYLRPEMKFDGLPGLIAQMQADCAQARAILTAA